MLGSVHYLREGEGNEEGVSNFYVAQKGNLTLDITQTSVVNEKLDHPSNSFPPSHYEIMSGP